MTERLASLACALVFLGLVGCGKPKVGDACKIEKKESCEIKEKGATSANAGALVCQGGKWKAIRCKGPKGCVVLGGESECDQSFADDGETCNLENDHGCSSDRKAVVGCKKGKWSRLEVCGGEKGCARFDKEVTCDNSVANPEDSCLVEKDYACSTDKKTTLVCKGGKFEASTPCRGPKGCALTPKQVHCDDTIAEPNDACETRSGERFACSVDLRTVLKCEAGKFVLKDKCSAKQTCKIENDGVGCGS